jgi:hypothetical protein
MTKAENVLQKKTKNRKIPFFKYGRLNFSEVAPVPENDDQSDSDLTENDQQIRSEAENNEQNDSVPENDEKTDSVHGNDEVTKSVPESDHVTETREGKDKHSDRSGFSPTQEIASRSILETHPSGSILFYYFLLISDFKIKQFIPFTVYLQFRHVPKTLSLQFKYY